MNKAGILLLLVLVSMTASDAWLLRRVKRFIKRTLNPFRSRRRVIILPPYYHPYYYSPGKREVSEIDLNEDGILDSSELTQSGMNERDVQDLRELLNLDGKSDIKVNDVKRALEMLD